jgi:hypothetical protein
LPITKAKPLPKKPSADKSDYGLEPSFWASKGTTCVLHFRSKVQQNVNQSLLKLEGVNDRQAASYYFGKRVVYIYKTLSGEKDKRFRVSHVLFLDYLGKNQQITR